MVSEIFSTSFLVSIAVCLILVGGLFAYFNYRFSEQNHKMQSMLGLVSTMAEEMQYFRSKLTNKSVEQNDTDNEANTNVQIIPNFLGGNNELIEVSDSEEGDDEEDEDDDDDEDLNEDDDEDDDLNDDDEDEDDDLNDELSELDDLEDDDNTNKKVINIDLGTNNNDFVIESEDINLDDNDNNDNDNNDNNKNVKNINIDFNIDNDNDDLNLENMEMSLKSISIDETVSSKGKEDYKKMSLNKLRDVVCSKGLVVDASKLKKNELLKLLGDE